MIQWHFYDKVYRIWVYLMIGTDDDLIQELKDVGFTDINDIDPSKAKGYMIRLYPDRNTTGQNCTLIWMRKYETTSLVHEVSHLVIKTFHDKGIEITDDNTEVFAFYMEYWCHEIMSVRKRFPKGRAPKLAKK